MHTSSSSSPSNISSCTPSLTSPPMAANSTPEGCDSFTGVDLSDENNNAPHCEPHVALSKSVEVYVPLESQLTMDDQTNSQTYMVESAGDYSKCSEKDVDIEKGKSGVNEESVGNLKNEEGQMKQISFEMGGKYMQFLMNHSLILPKFSTRGEAPRMKKYKRAASFNSRKVVLMFSLLSSLGTIILIYLTLRVKTDG